MRKNKIINNYYSVKINKKIPVYAGLGGGTSNAATLLKHLTKKNLDKKTLSRITSEIGSDLKLFFHLKQLRFLNYRLMPALFL